MGAAIKVAVHSFDLTFGRSWRIRPKDGPFVIGIRPAVISCHESVGTNDAGTNQAIRPRRIKLVRKMPRDPVLDEPKRQLVKAACGTFGNYRSACRGRSHAEFAAKLGVALDEADESEGWLEIFDADGVATSVELRRVLQEASELRAIFFKSNQTAQANRASRRERG